MIDMSQALLQLRPGTRWVLKGSAYSGLNWLDETQKPTQEEINSKIAELEAAEPMRLLRIERNYKLAETDWRMVKDYKGTDQISWETYRQALRDLPATAEPQLDSQGNLTNITWPEVPA